LILVAAWQGNVGTASLVTATLYGAVNLLFLSLLRDVHGGGAELVAGD
jgi:hypothetical protein